MKKLFYFVVFVALLSFNNAMCQWTTSGNNIYNTNSGNVGIGNNAPSTLLYVAKNMSEPTITIRNIGGFGGATYVMQDDASGANWKFKATLNGGFKIRDHASLMDVIVIEPNSFANAIYIKSTDNIGMGTANPNSSALLDMTSTTKGFLPPRMNHLERNVIANPSQGLIIWCSTCGATGELQVFNGNVWTNMVGGAAAPALVIGNSYQGGKIAYILQPGDPGYIAGGFHGLIAASSNQSAGAEWGCGPSSIPGADGTALGTGNQNTIDIMAACATPGIAARLCGDYTGGGYSDWYLPSKDELNKLYLNRVAIGGFVDWGYYSSSEYNADAAWGQQFINGVQYHDGKGFLYYVRAVRSF